MTQVRDLMTPMPQTIGFDISVEKALEMMKEFSCHHLPVLDGGKLVGVLSDRDLSIARHDPKNVKTEHLVMDLMSDAPIVIKPSTEINTAIRTMLDNKINSLIIQAEENQPWGILTSTDLLRYVVEKS
ncbi:CBS domain-containing protein [Nitrosomonas sp.]|uniref:CBS domain-containing protein n=1 Tax=Nitrosomonas sp. TaxID=42353 RepID=UPI0025F6F8FC|nr:CBS domain-containing protein [Nitrosomonas sp.]